MSYDNETCEGCVWWSDSYHRCINGEVVELKRGTSRGARPCPCFLPSLDCRKVRALEGINAKLAACRTTGDGAFVRFDGETESDDE